MPRRRGIVSSDYINIEKEPFPDWMEEKIDLPIFEDLPPLPLVNSLNMLNPGMKPSLNSNLDMVTMKTPQIIDIPSPMDIGIKQIDNIGIEVTMKPQTQTLVNLSPIHYQPPPPPQTSLPVDQTPSPMQELLQDNTMVTADDTLTPPDSLREADLVFTMLQEMQPHELVELVRMRVESPVNSQCESESVANPSASDSYCSNPEWTMASTSDAKVPKRRRRVMEPYSHKPPEEKRVRKKEQNKNAAESESVANPSALDSYCSNPEWMMTSTSDAKVSKRRRVTEPYSRTPLEEKLVRKREKVARYRLKKKQQIKEILGEEKQQLQRNEQLKTELMEVRWEIKYLKNLMRDLEGDETILSHASGGETGDGEGAGQERCSVIPAQEETGDRRNTGEVKQLLQRNERLKTELTEKGREIKYLKNLMCDLFKAKGQ